MSKLSKEEADEKTSVYNSDVKASFGQKKILFDNLMSYAKIVIENHEQRQIKCDQIEMPERHPIFDTIKLIGLRLQTKYITNLLYQGKEFERLPNIDAWHVLFSISEVIDKSNGKKMYDFFMDLPAENERVVLKEDLVLPWPWNKGRQLNSMVNIGKGRFWGEWEEKSNNHNIEFWLPMRIGFVNGGNHSISAGILNGVGDLKPAYVYDISPIYEHVYTDGINFYRTNGNTIIAKALSVEFAALFEIGRLMKDKNITKRNEIVLSQTNDEVSRIW
ncbi:DUF6710 family protein [Paenibacillus chitinolyticus]|nr:DUF6710 family protein [Paenibacillus chitinolyticus]MCY9594140.1 hypothetical protein [Paenibacillus chitinolyticus]MCY9599653.1 hypothetical protein [Paenibacillus chitinolyticus]